MARARLLAAILLTGTAVPAMAQAQQKVPADPAPPSSGPSPAPKMEELSTDEIFKRMFGKERPPIAAGRYSVIVDGTTSGETYIEPREPGSVETSFLRSRVLPLLVPEAADRFKPLLEGSSVSFQKLRDAGLDVSFDPGQLVLSISIPMSMRSTRILPLNPPRLGQSVSFVEQADVSAYASFRGGFDIVEHGSSRKGFTGFATNADLGLNVHGIVAQLRLRYEDGTRGGFTRGDARLTWDDVDSLVRYELGDLSVNRRPFQVSPRIAGFSAYREYRINPYLNYRTSGERGFELETSSRVEVVVNGSPLRTFSLEAGRYLLRDLPLVSSATNDVEIRITEANGTQRVMSFPAFTDIDLLDVGRTEFAINAGLPYADRDGVRVYDDGNFNVMGFVRRGLTPTLTAGLQIEADKDLALIGAEVSWASPIGTLNVNASFDAMHPGLDRASLQARYAWRDANLERGRFIDADIVLSGEDFRTLDRVLSGSPSSILARARIGQSITNDLRVQLAGSYERVRDPDPGERWSVGATLYKQFGRLSLTGSLDYERDRGRSGVVGRLSLFVPLGRGTLSSSFVSRGGAARLDYIKPPAAGVGSLGYQLGLERRDGADRQFASATYVGNRFEATVDQSRVSASGRSDVRTGVAFGTAIVMADGGFGLSRPVTNSFAIVERPRDYRGRVGIEPRSGLGGTDVRYSAFAGSLGPGVVPDLPAYYERDLEAVPLGENAASGDVFHLRPGFRSGYRLRIGSQAGSVSALGVLVGRDGRPLPLVAGEARKSGGPEDAIPATFFTNASGRFFLEGLEAGGSYEVIVTVAGVPSRFSIEVPKDAKGVWTPTADVRIDAIAPAAKSDLNSEETQRAND